MPTDVVLLTMRSVCEPFVSPVRLKTTCRACRGPETLKTWR
jgi:hypothetical protein